MTSKKFDPRIKETPDLPGEVYDDVQIKCERCERGIYYHEQVIFINHDTPVCESCAGELEAMWELYYDAQQEENDDDEESR